MARRCPISNELVLYLECMECDQKNQCRKPAGRLNGIEGSRSGKIKKISGGKKS